MLIYTLSVNNPRIINREILPTWVYYFLYSISKVNSLFRLISFAAMNGFFFYYLYYFGLLEVSLLMKHAEA